MGIMILHFGYSYVMSMQTVSNYDELQERCKALKTSDEH